MEQQNAAIQKELTQSKEEQRSPKQAMHDAHVKRSRAMKEMREDTRPRGPRCLPWLLVMKFLQQVSDVIVKFVLQDCTYYNLHLRTLFQPHTTQWGPFTPLSRRSSGIAKHVTSGHEEKQQAELEKEAMLLRHFADHVLQK